jgi:cytochrome c oxidase assembly factor CtaG
VTSDLPLHWHVTEVAAVVVLAALYGSARVESHRRRQALAALAVLLVVVVWPFGDVAAEVSLSAAVVQRLVVMLLVVPVLLRATPVDWLEHSTRPAPVDAIARRLANPGVAVAFVTLLGTLTVSPTLVDAGARSLPAHLAVLALTAIVGVVLWAPVLGVVPGARRLSPAGRAGYLLASSLVVTGLSFVWIFATHPLYPGLHHQEEVLHVSALFDQQLAGFIAKLGAYVPMWAVAFWIFAHADEESRPAEESPLHWVDVERQLLRADRARARKSRRRHPL